MNKTVKLFFVSFILLSSCMTGRKLPSEPGNDLVGGRISTDGRRFIDSTGRQVIFNGINFVNKNASENYTYSNSDSALRSFRKLGFNCIRLGIIWDGVEPEPGKYNEEYLDKVEKQVREASELGLYVLLDMHQDLYSVAFSDGAPLWATLTDGLPHATGFVWSDSYFMSQAVQKAFDNFWENKPAPDGTGIQDHYANMWKHVAERFADNNNVLGYDIMNEPFNGTPGTMILPVILDAYGKLYAKENGRIYSADELYAIWGDLESRMKALEWMSDVSRYQTIIGAATELSQSFEKTDLQAMYQRVADRIREADTSHILFLEHSYFSNAGVRSGIEPVKLKNGTADPLVAYAAHGYDLLVDTKYYGQGANERVDYIFSQVNDVADSINTPVIIGEWGAFSGSSENLAAMAKATINLFEKYKFSQTYWAYYKGFEKDLYFRETFSRPFPRFINGTLASSAFNYKTGEFTCTWQESSDIEAGSVFFFPELKNIVREDILLTPEDQNIIIQSIGGSDAGYLVVPSLGVNKERTLSVKVIPEISSISISAKEE